MKKYYWANIYQVSKSIGYVKSGKEYRKMTIFQKKNYPYATWTLTQYDKLIMVEEIFPFLAREVKTGVLFPIISFKQNSSSKIEYKACPFIPIHTFVGSVTDTLDITHTELVQTSKELEKYNQMYPNANELQEALLNIIAIGKSNMNIKFEAEKQQLEYEKQQLEYKKQQTNEQKQAQKSERLKVRKLQIQFKQERKNIK